MFRLINLSNTLPWETCEMSVTLLDVWVCHLVRLAGRSICSKKMIEDFWDVQFSCVTVEGRVVDSKQHGFSIFSGNVFAALVYYPEVGDVGMGLVVGNAVFVNCTGDMTIVFFYSVFKTSAGFSNVRKVAIFFCVGAFVDYVLFLMWYKFIFEDKFRTVGSFEDDLYTGMSKDSSKFPTKVTNIGNRDDNIFHDFCKPVYVFTTVAAAFLSDSLIIQSGYLFLRRTLWKKSISLSRILGGATFWVKLGAPSFNLVSNQFQLVFCIQRYVWCNLNLEKRWVSKNEILPSLSGVSIVNLMTGSTEFKWLKRVSTCSFLI